jgi:ubiquitin carboxyl-terminal hydrolase 25/28
MNMNCLLFLCIQVPNYFIHEQGEASFGHYYSYMHDEQGKRWIKYNDSSIQHVSETEIFEDTTGKEANAYCLAYVKKSSRSLVHCFARNSETRKN